MAALGLENLTYEAATRLVFIEKIRLNLLTSHLQVKLGFLDSNLLRAFGGSNKVSFGDLELVLKLWKSATIFQKIVFSKKCTNFS